ncbi:MAG: twitching motility protein PilT [Meiothermus sp.]|uniref:type IV pilus twitching motility protein PilT n=1 Tax=Meiothermus sp. TaxID=1955249 RepID=UPI0021DBF0E6|nr:PilT/PilU family type 4a pilus ATPase [Meiothermus sp.]GIW26799.1 MAG: twitching motility protein PilT [Meiothermus sp.]
MHFEEMLILLVHKGASDIHLHAGMPVLARIGDELKTVSQSVITPEFTASLVEKLCTPQQKARLRAYRQVDVAYSLPGLTRLRVNLFYQRGSISAVLHTLSSEDTDLSKVNLRPEHLEFFRDQRRGLVLVTGPIGAGKSTTLAKLVDEINTHHTRIIVTVEDPIEYLHRPKRSAVIQREIGSDAISYEKALLAAMRQNADVIVIGEIRDSATAAAVLNAVYTGHLVLSTFVSSDSVGVLNRMLELFSQVERNINRVLLAESLLGIIHQRLVPATNGQRVPITEVITMTPRIREALKQPGQTDRLREVLREQGLEGYQSFDQNLLALYYQGLVDYQTARLHAQNPTQFELAVLRQSSGQGSDELA